MVYFIFYNVLVNKNNSTLNFSSRYLYALYALYALYSISIGLK